jgi:hypothetical protein
MRQVKKKKALTREEFLEICHWKSPRTSRWCEMNSASSVRRAMTTVFATEDEDRRLAELTSLHGVAVPTASAILTMIDPKNYGVIDIRVWQLLHEIGSVTKRASGQGFDSQNWLQYLQILRDHAKQLKVNVRRIEKALFEFHKRIQIRPIYSRSKKVRRRVVP